jgi:uncharacterized protein
LADPREARHTLSGIRGQAGAGRQKHGKTLKIMGTARPPAPLEPAIVVTGASSGIGRELARVASRDGSFMLLVGRSPEPLGDLASELRAAGVQADVLLLDLTEPAAGEKIEAALRERGLYCDVLVNSAGFGLLGAAAKIDRAEQMNLLDTNARALTELTLRFLPGMVARGGGGILNVGSVAGYTPGPGMVVYYATKAYVNSFSQALAAEVAGNGVTVTCLAPGPVRTAFFKRAAATESRMSKLLPRTDATETAEAGWRGFHAGKRLVIPRLMHRMVAIVCTLVPNAILLPLIAALQRPARTAERTDKTGQP